MWWKKKEKQQEHQQEQYEMILTKHYTLTVYLHNPKITENEWMRIVLTESWDEERDVMIDYKKYFIRTSVGWCRVIQRYKMSEYDYALVVENMSYYRELEEYKINKKDINEE